MKRFQQKKRSLEIDGVSLLYVPLTMEQILSIQEIDPGSNAEQTRRMIDILDANVTYGDGEPLDAKTLPPATASRIFEAVASNKDALGNFS